MQNQSIGDLHIKFERTKTGKTLATVRLTTSAEVRWHRVSLPAGTPAYALYEKIAQDSLKRILGVPGVMEVMMQPVLPM